MRLLSVILCLSPLLCSFLKSKKSFDRYRHFDTMFTTSNPSFIKQIPANDTGDILICEIPFEPEVNLKEWKKFLEDSLPLNDVYPDSIKAGTYQISVQFEIDEKGKINNVKILKNPGYGLGERVAAIISKYKGSWKPATIYGRPIKSYRVQPITFVIEEDEEECEEEIPDEIIL